MERRSFFALLVALFVKPFQQKIRQFSDMHIDSSGGPVTIWLPSGKHWTIKKISNDNHPITLIPFEVHWITPPSPDAEALESRSGKRDPRCAARGTSPPFHP